MKDVKGNDVSMRDLGAFAMGVVFTTIEFANMPREALGLILAVSKEMGVFDSHLPLVFSALFRMEKVAAEKEPGNNMGISEMIDGMTSKLPMIAKYCREAIESLPNNEEAQKAKEAMLEFASRIEAEIQ